MSALYLGDRVEYKPGDEGIVMELEVSTSHGRASGARIKWADGMETDMPYAALRKIWPPKPPRLDEQVYLNEIVYNRDPFDPRPAEAYVWFASGSGCAIILHDADDDQIDELAKQVGKKVRLVISQDNVATLETLDE